ncbi:MAG TPA: phosphatase PAP2 family protein [Thermoanaerobaculaceae bacterium]|nr:phosphatase PAP2 family protein [Thermoanaerobaculaceae bacterium]
MSLKRGIAGALLAVAAGGTGWALLAAWTQVRRDAAALVSPDRPQSTERLVLAAGVFGVAVAADADLVVLARHGVPPWIDGFKRWGTGKTANLVGVGMVAGGVGLGQLRLALGGLTLLEGNLVVGQVVDALKQEFGRIRPNHAGAGAWSAGGDSFPSSHAAHAFLIASVLDATLEKPEWRLVVYSVATGVGLQRLHEGVHYPTDVLAGAALGWWIGHRLAVSHGLAGHPEAAATLWEVPPSGGGLIAPAF